MFLQIEVAKPKISHFNGRLFSSLKKSAIKGNSLPKSIFLTNRIPLRGSKLRAASRKSWTQSKGRKQREERNA